jgi:hypothetical protein
MVSGSESPHRSMGCCPFDALEGCIVPWKLPLEVLSESGAAGGVEHGLADMARAALFGDGYVCVAVWIHWYHCVEAASGQLSGGKVVAYDV